VTAPALLLQPSPASGRPACSWCSRRLDRFEALKGARTCSRKCRQATFRLRELALEHGADRLPSPGPRLRVSYNDPPYPTLAKRYYRDQPTYAGEVDHPALIATLEARRARGDLAGWALSTSVRALRDLLPLCPPEARVASWVKPIGARAGTLGIHNVWEPLIVVPGRRLRPACRDMLVAQPARHGGDLPGRKPLAFCAWMFGLLGLEPGDQLEDAFPGTGIVGRAWAELSRAAEGEPKHRDHTHGGVSPARSPGDASPRGPSDAKPARRAPPAPADSRSSRMREPATSRPRRQQLALLPSARPNQPLNASR
jgi:hypothetical protein